MLVDGELAGPVTPANKLLVSSCHYARQQLFGKADECVITKIVYKDQSRALYPEPSGHTGAISPAFKGVRVGDNRRHDKLPPVRYQKRMRRVPSLQWHFTLSVYCLARKHPPRTFTSHRYIRVSPAFHLLVGIYIRPILSRL